MTSLLIKQTTITVIRKSAGDSYDDNGRVIPATEETLSLSGNIFPITEEEIQFLPEGTRLDSVFKVRTSVPLKQNIDGQQADVVVIAGKNYQVISCGDWTTHQNPVMLPKFYRSHVQLLEVQS